MLRSILEVRLIFVFLLLFIVYSSGVDAAKLRSEVDITKWAGDIYVKVKKPKGNGPFPAVVLMHGCQGLTASSVQQALGSWTSLFRKNGYVTLIVDSFKGRGNTGGEVCLDYRKMQEALYYRVWDAFVAHEYLSKLPYVNGEIYLVGQSNGGSTAINVARKVGQSIASSNRKFTAIAALYPGCLRLVNEDTELISPLLILAGQLDDWAPAEECTNAKNIIKDEKLNVIVYPNAHHSFDLNIPVQSYAGYTVGFNSFATSDSREQIISFFNKYKTNN